MPGRLEEVGFQAVLKGAADYARNAGRIKQSNKGILDDMANLNFRAGKLSGGMSRFGLSMTGAFAAGAVAVTALAVPAAKFAADFEQTLSRIAGLTDTPREAIAGLREDIITLSKEIGLSPDELGAGAYFILSSGISDTATAMRVLELSSKAAVSGLGDTQTVARTTTAIMNAYGLSVQDVDKVINTLVGTVRKGAGAPEELANSLGFIIPLAAQMGVEFEQLGAVLATLTNIGLNADNAVTALKGVLSQLIAPTDQSKELFDALAEATGDSGLQIENFRKEIDQNFVGAMTRLFSVIGENDAIIAELFPDIRGLIGALGAFGSQGDATRRILEDLSTDTTFLDQAFNAASNTTNFKFRKALNNLKVEMVELGTKILPAVAVTLDQLNLLFAKFDTLVSAIADSAGEVWDDFLPATQLLAEDVRTLAEALADLVRLLHEVIPDPIEKLALAAAAAGVAFLVFGPTGTVVVALAATIAAVELLRSNVDDLGTSALEARLKIEELALAASVGPAKVAAGAKGFLDFLTGGDETAASEFLGKIADSDEALEERVRETTKALLDQKLSEEQLASTHRLLEDNQQSLAVAIQDGEQGLTRWAFAFANAQAEEEALRRGLPTTNQGIIDFRNEVFEATNSTLLYVNALSPIPNTLQLIANAAEEAGVPVAVFAARMVFAATQAATAAAIAKFAESTLLTAGANFAQVIANVAALSKAITGIREAETAAAAGAGAGVGAGVGGLDLGGLTDTTEDAVEEIESIWLKGARDWMRAIDKGILEGTVTVLDALHFLEKGMIDAAASIVSGLSAKADQMGEQWKILIDILEAGAVEISQVERLFDIGASEAALDLLRFLAGKPSNIGEAIDKFQQTHGPASLFPTANLQQGGFVPAGRATMATLHGPEIVVPLRDNGLDGIAAALGGLGGLGGGASGFRNYGSVTVMADRQDVAIMRSMRRALGAA